jgi:leucyl aminopeptidase
MQALAVLRPRGVRVIGIFGTTENLLGPAAYKPGDIVATAAGKTIEVINTDAEGRVVPGRRPAPRRRLQADAIIDLATLTGRHRHRAGHRDGRPVLPGRRAGRAPAGRQPPHARAPVAHADLRRVRREDQEQVGRHQETAPAARAGSCTAAQFLFHFSQGIPHAAPGHRRDRLGRPQAGLPHGRRHGFGVRLLYDALVN